jgi:hypothetical protein
MTIDFRRREFRGLGLGSQGGGPSDGLRRGGVKLGADGCLAFGLTPAWFQQNR